jgi:selenocysteine lyase/cysteine desulfurase
VIQTADVERLALADAQSLWRPAGTYLNTASYGLPPATAWDALQAALADWRGGRTSWEHWGAPGEDARASFARLLGVPTDTVAIAANVSTLLGLVAASVPDGARVVAPDVEFTSVLFPFMAQAERDVTVELVPVHELAGSIGPGTDIVAFSAVQMATGEVADLAGIAAAAAEHGVMTVVDATQAVGWLPFDGRAFDVVAAHAYKWLMSPRGTAFMAIRPEHANAVTPHAAGWYAGEDPLATFFGPPLRLAESARRFDTSPAWFMWVATAPALETIERIGVEAIHEHDVGLANRFRKGLGLGPGDSAIVFCDVEGAAEKLEEAGIRAAVRGGRLRTSWHVYNTAADVDRTLDVLCG